MRNHGVGLDPLAGGASDWRKGGNCAKCQFPNRRIGLFAGIAPMAWPPSTAVMIMELESLLWLIRNAISWRDRASVT